MMYDAVSECLRDGLYVLGGYLLAHGHTMHWGEVK